MGRNSRSREDRGPKVFDFRPARQGTMSENHKVLPAGDRLRQMDRDIDLPRRFIPTVSDDLPIELGYVGVADDTSANTVSD